MPEEKLEYDEQQVLTRYIWHNYMGLMSDTELLAFKAVSLRFKAEAAGSSPMREALLEKAAQLEDPRVKAALQEGVEPFRHAVRERLLRRYPRRINLNRCPKCDRIPRTPRARQCPWCFHSWR